MNDFGPKFDSCSADQASTSESDFERQFRPFAVRKNVSLAPVNRFHVDKTKPPPHAEVIVLDDDGDVQMVEASSTAPSPKISTTTELPSDPKGTHCAVRI